MEGRIKHLLGVSIEAKIALADTLSADIAKAMQTNLEAVRKNGL